MAATSPSPTADPVDDTAGAPPRRRWVRRPPALGALSVGVAFWLESLRPTLLPHPAANQGVVGGLSLLIGYGIGGLVIGLCLVVNRHLGWAGPSSSIRHGARIAFALLAAVGVVGGSLVWLAWQNDQRRMVTMPTVGLGAVLAMLAITVVVVVLVGAIARLVGVIVGWGDRRIGRLVPSWLAHGIVAFVVVLVAVGLFNKVVVDMALGGLSRGFEAGDATTAPGVVQPTSSEVSGGPGSLVAWDTLGLQGRSWVAGASTAAELHHFAGAGVPVEQPIRIYAGLKSAATDDERAALAVRDLERAGGFSRKVLVVAGATGSGWVNPVASSALEYEWHGDSAMISMQYSYLPSWIAFLTDLDTASAAGDALTRAVYDKWSTLPASTRPKLIIFGESLGSYATEGTYKGSSAATSVAAITSHADGVLWVGPPNSNPVWQQITAARTPGSPVWRPVYGDSTRVVFANDAGELPRHATTTSRIVYLQHPSDPVTWWSMPTLWRAPAWLDHPRGADIPSQASWFPIVTWLQTTGDLIEGFSTPAGHGHNYNNAWAQAMTSEATPVGWTHADTERLAAAMVELHGLGAN